jgi:hypothetical protein
MPLRGFREIPAWTATVRDDPRPLGKASVGAEFRAIRADEGANKREPSVSGDKRESARGTSL